MIYQISKCPSQIICYYALENKSDGFQENCCYIYGLALQHCQELIKGFTDRHIYSNQDSVLTKTGAAYKGYPWGDPAYMVSAKYTRAKYSKWAG
ncbi:MAG TPA: hypothetical protein GYA03_08775 [Tissierellia bacterium]|nr:hypothetical protein [Tissierellia bacterium]